MTDRDPKQVMADAVAAYRELPTGIPVSTAIKAMTGCDVIPLSDDPEDRELVDLIKRAASNLIAESQIKPITTGRLNELGNAIEEPLLNALVAVGATAAWPLRADGSGGRSGYPDIAINLLAPRPAYLEAKVVGSGQENSSFRSFYLSPSDRPKVVHQCSTPPRWLHSPQRAQ